jgi:hypothetical protein
MFELIFFGRSFRPNYSKRNPVNAFIRDKVVRKFEEKAECTFVYMSISTQNFRARLAE